MSQPQADTIPLLPLVPPNDGVIPYSTARRDMQDCDLLFWRGDYFISKLFERATGGYYSHAAIAARWDDRLMLLQAEAAGIQAVPLHITVARYPGLVDWFQLTPEGRAQVDTHVVLKRAQHYLGLQYGYAEVFRSLAHRLFGIGHPHDPKHPHAMFCSEFVATAFMYDGFEFNPEHPQAIDTMPQDIANSRWVKRMGTIHPDPSMPRVNPAVPPPSEQSAQVGERVPDRSAEARLHSAGSGS